MNCPIPLSPTPLSTFSHSFHAASHPLTPITHPPLATGKLVTRRHRYDSKLSSNYGSDFVEKLGISRTAICTRGENTDDSTTAYFYGERTGNGCGGDNCFMHSYGGGFRIFEFLEYEIEGSTHRFMCPLKADDGMYVIILPQSNICNIFQIFHDLRSKQFARFAERFSCSVVARSQPVPPCLLAPAHLPI